MTPEQLSEYLDSFTAPAEVSFFTEAQKENLKNDKKALENTRIFVSSIINNENFEDVYNKAVLDNRILNHSKSEMVYKILRAIEVKDGDRVDLNESLVSKSGQTIIMSGRLQNILGYFTDSYMTQEETAELTSALQRDGLPSPEVDKVTAAMNKFGAVLLQRGVYQVLKNLLEESVGRPLSLYSPNSQPTPKTTLTPQPASVLPTTPKVSPQASNSSYPELPVTFIEYLKSTDSNLSQVIKGIAADETFTIFFNNLKKYYTYYQGLTAEQMAEQVIIRPQLWTKISPENQSAVKTLVDENIKDFHNKPQKTATTNMSAKKEAAHGASLDDLKAKLGNQKPVATTSSTAQTSKPNNGFVEELKRELNTKELEVHKSPKPIESHKSSELLEQHKSEERFEVKGTGILPEKIEPEIMMGQFKKPLMSPPKVEATINKPRPLTIPKVRNHTPKHGLPDLHSIRNVDMLAKIEPAHLRQGPLDEQIALIKSALQYLAKHNNVLPISLIPKFEKSILFQTYLNVGALMLNKNEGDENKNVVMDEIMEELESQGKDCLNQQEFEAVADLKKELEILAGL